MLNLEKLEHLAREEARRLHHPYIRCEHLLLALLSLPEWQAPMAYEKAHAAISEMRSPTCGAEEKLVLAEGAKRAIAYAQGLAGQESLSVENLLAGILAYSPIAKRLFNHRDSENTEKSIK